MLTNRNEMNIDIQPIDCITIEKEDSSDFIDKVNIGIRESAKGLVNTKEESKLKLSKWLK